ncbi:hypothetical protein [Aliivibrio fischeri]|uniref:hypothetical protein n=1 Tax=Aliivibrio fischeri TaxID=668 RepID=UPI0007C44EC7|nr:hypothetical protein [Aliivibrio fischeri]
MKTGTYTQHIINVLCSLTKQIKSKIMYILITTHDYPEFYQLNGSPIHVDLEYTQEKITTYIENLEVITQVIKSKSGVTTDGIWMIKNQSDALQKLGSLNVFPFQTKTQAKLFAKHHNIKNYRYLKV